jgi:DNA-binding transcriptional regulator YdaS (Cro superfamily)
MLDHIERAAEAVGGKGKLAELLNVSRPTLYSWNEVPCEAAVKIHKLTKGKITVHAMRPDLWTKGSNPP